MKKSIAMAVLVTLFAVSAAQAAGPITRNGADANGSAQPGRVRRLARGLRHARQLQVGCRLGVRPLPVPR